MADSADVFERPDGSEYTRIPPETFPNCDELDSATIVDEGASHR